MKRLITALVLLAIILSISCWSMLDMGHKLQWLIEEASSLRKVQPGAPQIEDKSLRFVSCWEEAENRLIFYIHHDTLDHISQLVYELPALAHYEEYGDFYGRLDALEALFKDLLKSSVPNYRNLL